ncbi:MAG: hypothetical protein KC621_29905, partial [Myxococcales bacterium]|nr:hypothetical protein [Myxococcales bacterium]
MLFVACAHAAVPEGLTWLDDARPPDDRPVLAVSAATWDPLSRSVLERALAGSGDRIAVVALSEQGPEAWHDLLAATGWQGLSVGLDPSHELVRSWVGGPELGELVLVREGTDVWRRRVRSADDPALNDLLAAGMPVERSGTRIEDIATSVEEGSLRELRRKVVLLPPEPDVDWVDVVNAAAWRLVTDEGARKKDVALGLDLATRLVEGAGRDDPGVIDTWARAAWASGLREEALAAEERAVPLAEGMPYEQELIEVRDTWRVELGVVIAPDPWKGSVNAAWDDRSWSALVVPPSEDWAGEGEKLSKMLEIGLSTPEGADRSGSMVVYGTPDENPLVAELLAHHRI